MGISLFMFLLSLIELRPSEPSTQHRNPQCKPPLLDLYPRRPQNYKSSEEQGCVWWGCGGWRGGHGGGGERGERGQKSLPKKKMKSVFCPPVLPNFLSRAKINPFLRTAIWKWNYRLELSVSFSIEYLSSVCSAMFLSRSLATLFYLWWSINCGACAVPWGREGSIGGNWKKTVFESASHQGL